MDISLFLFWCDGNVFRLVAWVLFWECFYEFIHIELDVSCFKHEPNRTLIYFTMNSTIFTMCATCVRWFQILTVFLSEFSFEFKIKLTSSLIYIVLWNTVNGHLELSLSFVIVQSHVGHFSIFLIKFLSFTNIFVILFSIFTSTPCTGILCRKKIHFPDEIFGKRIYRW